MISLWNVAALIIALVVARISHWLYRWSNPKCNGKLPPGSMGFPIIGETLDFFKPCGFQDIPNFVKKRMIRYGPLFRTNLFGSKTVVSTDPEVNMQIFREESMSFEFGYPDIFPKVFGDSLFIKDVFIQKYIHGITSQIIGAKGLKAKMIGHMDKAIGDHFRLKASQEGSFDVYKEVQKLVVTYMTPKLISNLKPETQSKLIDNMNAISAAWYRSFLSFSTWKALFKTIKSRREAMQVMREVMGMRKVSGEKQEDFMNTMVEELEKDGTIFDQESALNLIFMLAFVGREGTAGFSAVVLKFISKYPKVIAELKREHKAIVENRKDKEGGVTWEEYTNNMPFTNMVINESLRLANTTPLLFRKAVHDVKIKEYTIPAGWIVAVAPSPVHHDPAIYENPFEFNPWRWEGKEMVWGSKTFMAFGGGVRLCVGAQFARLHIAIFLHHLVAYYDFSLVQDAEIIRTPLLQFTKRLLINISPSDPTM